MPFKAIFICFNSKSQDFDTAVVKKPSHLDNQTMMGSMTFGVNFWGVEFHIT